jgi:conjugative relaxase-like TrwC/TraI family protein
MLNVTRIAAQAVRDYYARMAALSEGSSYWYGDGAYALGFSRGEPVDANDLYALCAIGPKAAVAIASGQRATYGISDIEEHQAQLERPRVPGYDLTFSAAKSISLAYLAHPDENTRNAVALAHRLAVDNALAFLQDKAGLSRLTVQGEVTIVPGEMAFAGFTHYTNRDIEPHLHTHVLVPNVVRCDDGKWRSLHNKELYRWYMSAGAIYRASLREHMTHLTNAEWSILSDGWRAELTGLANWRGADGAELLPAFSLRHKEAAELRERLENLSPTGTISPKTRRSVAVRTRKAKDFGQGDANIEEVRQTLRDQLDSVWNLGDNEWNQILGAYDDPRPDVHQAGLWLRIPTHLAPYGSIPLVENTDDLVDYLARVLFYGSGPKEGLLSSKAYVTVQDIHAGVYNLVGGFVESDVLNAAIEKLIAGEGRDAALRLVPLVPALYVGDKQLKPERLPIRYYATSAVLNSEHTVLELASVPTTAGTLAPEVVNDYLAATLEAQRKAGRYLLSDEQQDALRHLFGAETTATLLMGAQGAGKTTLFRHFAMLAKEHDITVWGLAPQGTAVQKLGDTLRTTDPKAKALTIESFVWQVNSGFLAIPPNTCIILDESSQVDTLELAETLNLVRDAGAKLILVGDDRQLGSVRYGGMFATLYAKLGGARLVTTRRAANAGDRVAQASLRMGDLREALRTYDQMGRIEVTDDGLALMESASAWLRKEFELGTDSFVITNTKAEEMTANALAHKIWGDYRVAWLDGYLKTQKLHHRISNDLYEQRLARARDENLVLNVEFSSSPLELRMGDLVAIRRSVKVDKTTRLFNGQRGRIVDITDTSVVLYIEDESSARHVRIPRTIIDDERNRGMFSYGWASTVFRTQSMELGMSEGSLKMADSVPEMVADTPVIVKMRKRGPDEKRNVKATFLEDKGDKITVRLLDGTVRTVERSKVSVAPEVAAQMSHVAIEARDGNALVIGTEGMNLDALLVAASRARQRTNFIFRSALDTESDHGSEARLTQADKAEVARATLTLYLARQSRGEEPDSAYLRLARERETLSLALNTDPTMLKDLQVWLSDHMRSGELDIAFDTSTQPVSQEREHVLNRLAKLEEQLRGTTDAQLQVHLGTEIDNASATLASIDKELTRMRFFSSFIEHAKGAMTSSEGKVVLDARYVRDRLALVDDAIGIAEDHGSWAEAPDAIEVPLPENTAREIVDMSAREIFERQEGSDAAKRAKLFANVSYRVASDWMVIATNIYDQALGAGITIDDALASLDVNDRDRARIREAIAAVAVGRLNPTPVGHQLTLKTLREESLEADADPALVALVDYVTESIAEIREREADARSFDEMAWSANNEEYIDEDALAVEDWEGIEMIDDTTIMPGVLAEDEFVDDDEWEPTDWVPPEGDPTSTDLSEVKQDDDERIFWNEIFYRVADDGGHHHWEIDWDKRREMLLAPEPELSASITDEIAREALRNVERSTRIPFVLVDISEPIEVRPGEWYSPSPELLAQIGEGKARNPLEWKKTYKTRVALNPEINPAPIEPVASSTTEKQYEHEIFCKTGEKRWDADLDKRTKLLKNIQRNMERRIKAGESAAYLNAIKQQALEELRIDKVREIVPGEWYSPSPELLAKIRDTARKGWEKERREAKEALTRTSRDGEYYSPSPKPSQGQSQGGGYGYRYQG